MAWLCQWCDDKIRRKRDWKRKKNDGNDRNQEFWVREFDAADKIKEINDFHVQFFEALFFLLPERKAFKPFFSVRYEILENEEDDGEERKNCFSFVAILGRKSQMKHSQIHFHSGILWAANVL